MSKQETTGKEFYESADKVITVTKQEALGGYLVLMLPLEMRWQPQEDITTYELAMCLPYLIRSHAVMPFEVDQSLPHFRHFKIIDHNKSNGGDK